MVFKNILSAIDGSELSELACEKAIKIAIQNKANLDLISIIDNAMLKDVSSFDTDYVHQIKDKIENKLNKLVKRAKESGITAVNSFIELGNPKIILTKDNFTNPHDLIVIGATGMNKIDRLFIGSVTDYVLNNSKSNCLVVKK